MDISITQNFIDLSDFVELREIESLQFLIDVFGKRDGRQVAHGGFVLVGVLHDLGTVSGENTVKYTAMLEWLIETERVGDFTQIFDGHDFLKVK